MNRFYRSMQMRVVRAHPACRHTRCPNLQFDKRTIFTTVQNSLIALQEITDLQWWATIALSTVFVKVSLLPLVRSQIMASKRFQNCSAEIGTLYSLLSQNLASTSGKNFIEKMQAIRNFRKGVNATLTIHDASLSTMLVVPLVNLSVFMTFVISVRNLIEYDPIGVMSCGGMLWFKDIAAVDPTMALPITALLSTYVSLDLAFSDKGDNALMYKFKDIAQTIVILSLPFVTALPSGVFCYWIPSSLFGIAQTLTLRSPRALKLLNIPLSTKDQMKGIL